MGNCFSGDHIAEDHIHTDIINKLFVNFDISFISRIIPGYIFNFRPLRSEDMF